MQRQPEPQRVRREPSTHPDIHQRIETAIEDQRATSEAQQRIRGDERKDESCSR